MSDKKTDSTINPESLEKRIKSLEKDVKQIKMITAASLYGKYDEEVDAELDAELREGTLSNHEGLIKKYFHVLFLLFSLGILFFTFMTFAAVTGKGLKYLEKAGIKIEPIAVAGSQNNGVPEPEGPKIVTTSVDDDPVLGDANAPVTIVEFSDYDCPFCRVFHADTFPDIKKNLIDTGKVKFVYRDLPIKQLHPLSYEKAVAVNCAREQGGDAMYYQYHDALFGLVGSSPKSPTRDDLKKLAGKLALNQGQFNTCVDSSKYDDEIDKDITAAVSIKAFGTTTFIIGKSSSDGNITGTMVEGAAPYAEYARLVDELIK